MRTALLVLLACAAPALASQAVWKWVDDKGVTHYSDRPIPGAIKVELSSGNRWDSSTPRTSTPEPAAQPAEAGAARYQSFEIWRPANGEAMINTGGKVAVEIRLDPPLQNGHNINLYLDGKLVEGYQSNSTSYELADVPRGVHTLIATMRDGRGQRFQETPVVTFTVQQNSITQPPVGPTLRPPPKPRPRSTSNKLPSKQPTYADLNGARPVINPATNAPAPPQPAEKKP